MPTIDRRTLLRALCTALVVPAADVHAHLAQDAPVPSNGQGSFPGLADIGGLQSAVSRTYTHRSMLGLFLNGVTDEIEAMMPFLSSFTVTIASFDSDDAASAGQAAFDAIAETNVGIAFDTLTPLETPDLDDRTVAFGSHTDDFPDNPLAYLGPLWTGVIVSRFGASLVYASATGLGEQPVDDLVATTIALVTAIGEAEPGTAAPAFVADGTSSGGDWDRFPTGDDEKVAMFGGVHSANPLDIALYPEFLAY